MNLRGRRGRDRMVVWFTTTYAISAYHHWWCEFESRSGHYVIKFVSDLRQVGGFLWVLWFPPPINLHWLPWLIDWLILVLNATFSNISAISRRPVLEYPERTTDHEQATGNLSSLVAASRVHPFLWFTKPGANPLGIGDRLVWVVR